MKIINLLDGDGSTVGLVNIKLIFLTAQIVFAGLFQIH